MIPWDAIVLITAQLFSTSIETQILMFNLLLI